jgi:hypothetical protein
MGSERDCSVGIASRAGWEHFPQAEATVFAVKTDKVDLKANTSAAVVGFTRTFATAASRYGSIEWSPRGATHVHATWRTLGRATVPA